MLFLSGSRLLGDLFAFVSSFVLFIFPFFILLLFIYLFIRFSIIWNSILGDFGCSLLILKSGHSLQTHFIKIHFNFSFYLPSQFYFILSSFQLKISHFLHLIISNFKNVKFRKSKRKENGGN